MSIETSAAHQTEEQLRELIEIVETAKSMPMSGSAMVNRDEVLDILDEIVAHLPEELRAARWLLKERDEVRAKAAREAEGIIADAKSRVAQMVQEREIVKVAALRAEQITEDAEADARQMRREAEDYCDQKLASFEVVLDRLVRTVAAGRKKLQITIADSELGDGAIGRYEDEADSEAAAYFDQDLGD
ncbi:MAG TPA: hypothetical protein DEG43_06035 [Acidimicrobiaceae bacterium]|jgi:cell division septum initiation protein DivIVA|nr:hypothetical protein [Acidimicrobiaceae bacterium]